MSSVVAVSLLCLVVSSGCVSYERMASETKLGTHHVSVSPYCQSTSTRSRTHQEPDGSSRVLVYEFICGDTTVSIRDRMLSVNGKSYGLLNDGDKVTIDFGKVRVNSVIRAEVQ